MAFASATHSFRENVNFFGMQLAVRALIRGRTDEVARLDVGKAGFCIRHDFQVRRNRDRNNLAILRLHRQGLPIERIDSSVNPVVVSFDLAF